MTNEEKIQEITSEYSSEILRSGAYYGAKEMAEWKDEQFKQLVKSYIDIAYHECSDAHLLEELLKDI